MAASIRTIAQSFAGRRLPKTVKIVEVGPRDGLQNEKQVLATGLKVDLVQRLVAAGLTTVEVTSFVSPKWVPQMADSSDVFTQISKVKGVSYPVLTPNLKGYEAARKAGASEVAVFGASSESFSKKNINCSIDESLERFRPVVEAAVSDGVKVRGYVSCVLGCPYEGHISPEAVSRVAVKLAEMGCYEVSLGDTIGVGTPEGTKAMLDAVLGKLEVDKVAVHFHNTFGRALMNICQALTQGVSTDDSAVASLGGCPYAPGATGNVSTEDVVFLMKELGIETGVDLKALCEVAEWVSSELGRTNRSEFRLN
jgi:isopropylmalate/homocitrate/citramalate synthase